MTSLTVWPSSLPDELVELPEHVGRILQAEPRRVADVDELGDVDGALLIVLSGGDAAADALRALDPIIDSRTEPTVLVVGDGWIGTEGPDVASALVGAAAVALARSVAVRRHPTGRVNVVCVPERLVGTPGSQRGPLGIRIESADVAEVVAFALSGLSSYIDGQVLYANGGRQLFSSLTA